MDTTVSPNTPTATLACRETSEPADPPVRSRFSRRKKFLFALTALVLLSIPLLLVLELGVRVLSPQMFLSSFATDSGFGIRFNAPDVRARHRTPDYDISIRTNSMGIRADRDYLFEKPDDVVRIIGLGDSYAFGFGVEIEDAYYSQLECALRAQGIKAEVIPLCMPDMGTAEQVIMLSELGLKFDPDLVILGYFRNDIANNLTCGLYGLDGDSGLVRTADEYLPAVQARDCA